MRLNLRHLIERSRQKLGMSQVGLARAVGASPRSGQRWVAGQSRPRRAQLVALVRLLAPVDRELAELVAVQAGVTLAPPPPMPPTPAALPSQAALVARATADAIVCAAADAIDLAPRLVRVALAAALARARELGVDPAALEGALSEARPARG